MIIRDLSIYDVADLAEYIQCGDFDHVHDLLSFDAETFIEFWEETIYSQDGQILGAFEPVPKDSDEEAPLIAVMGVLYEPNQYNPDTVYLAEQFWATRKQYTHSKASLKLLDHLCDLSETFSWPIQLSLGTKSNPGMLWLLEQHGFRVVDITLERAVSHGEETPKETKETH